MKFMDTECAVVYGLGFLFINVAIPSFMFDAIRPITLLALAAAFSGIMWLVRDWDI